MRCKKKSLSGELSKLEPGGTRHRSVPQRANHTPLQTFLAQCTSLFFNNASLTCISTFFLDMYPYFFFCVCAIIIATLYELCRLYCELHSCTIRGTYQVTQQQADSANVKTLLFCAVKVLATSCDADVLRKIMHAYNIHDRAHRTSRSSANKAVFFPPAFPGHTHSNCRNNQQS